MSVNLILYIAQRNTRRQKDIARVLREKRPGPFKPFKKKDERTPGRMDRSKNP
jgi:hypothetical protein